MVSKASDFSRSIFSTSAILSPSFTLGNAVIILAPAVLRRYLLVGMNRIFFSTIYMNFCENEKKLLENNSLSKYKVRSTSIILEDNRHLASHIGRYLQLRARIGKKEECAGNSRDVSRDDVENRPDV